MVDALQEAQRVLTPSGVLIDVRPVIEPILVELVAAPQTVWAATVHTYSSPEDLSAADDAIQHALSRGWFVYESSLPFDFQIDCDSAAELRVYAEARKLRGAEIPYEELDERQREFEAEGQATRLRCRRPWMLSRYRKK